jgi:hypothetical protein
MAGALRHQSSATVVAQARVRRVISTPRQLLTPPVAVAGCGVLLQDLEGTDTVQQW